MSPEPEPHHEEEDEEEYAPQSIFAAGWFRAVLVLTVLAIVVVVSLPYLLNWFEPASPTVVSQPATPPVAPATPGTSGGSAAPPPAGPAETRGEPGAPAQKSAEPKAAAPAGPVEKPAPAAGADRGAAPKAPQKPVKMAESKPAPEKTARVSAPKAITALPAAPRTSAEARSGAGPERGEAKPTKAAGASSTGAAPAAGGGPYWVQLGVFKEEPNAQALARAIREDGFTVDVSRVTRGAGSTPAGSYHVVRAGSYPDLARATKAREALRAKGHQGFIARGDKP